MGVKFNKTDISKLVYRLNVESTENRTAYNFCTVDINPTNNCQLASISGFNTIVPTLKTDADLKDYFNHLQATLPKRLVLLDVNYKHVKRIKELMGKKVIASRNYKSTNNSRMTILIIQLR